jgi:ADP-ribose pyrophosphatase
MTDERKEVLGEGRYVRLVREGRWESVERVGCTGVVAIVAVTDAGELVCTEQLRHPVRRRVLEIPAGLAGDEGPESLEDAARRELEEETGFRAERLERLGEAAPSPGLTQEIVTFFRARGLRRVGAGGGDGTEEIRVHLVPLDGFEAWVARMQADGALVDFKLYVGLYHARTG